MVTQEGKVASIKLVKPSERPIKKVREKACATCGRLFILEPGQKYFDCPRCYQKKIVAEKAKKPLGSKVLTQIQCSSCGATEYVRFVPDDPKSVLCRTCFVRRGREQTK